MTTVVQDPEVSFVQIAGTNSNVYGLTKDGKVFQYYAGKANLWLQLNNRTREGVGYSEFCDIVSKPGPGSINDAIEKEHLKHNYATQD
jgi:hypothetical protein